MNDFGSGETVRAQDNSQLMTVVEKSGDGLVLCEWQDDEGNMQVDKFKATNLVKA
nr:hypothetical protein [Luteibacter rhizovicinus]